MNSNCFYFCCDYYHHQSSHIQTSKLWLGSFSVVIAPKCLLESVWLAVSTKAIFTSECRPLEGAETRPVWKCFAFSEESSSWEHSISNDILPGFSFPPRAQSCLFHLHLWDSLERKAGVRARLPGSLIGPHSHLCGDSWMFSHRGLVSNSDSAT